MEKRLLGKTNLSVTALGYGAMELRHVDEHEATRLLNAVLDSGINYVDTSPDYGPSEMYIGKAIAHRRSEYILATKCGCNIDETGKWLEPQHIWTRHKLLENIENSLRLLKTDYIDVWQLHTTVPSDLAGGKDDEVIKTLLEVKQQGKVRAVGISFRNGRPGDPLYPAGYGFAHMQEFLSWGVFDVMQVVYGAMVRQCEDLIGEAAAKGVGMIIRGVVRRYHDNYDALFAKAGLQELLAPGETMSDFFIRFALNHSGLSTMIIGTKNPQHLAANVAAVNKGKLPDDIYAEARRRLDAIGIKPGAHKETP